MGYGFIWHKETAKDGKKTLDTNTKRAGKVHSSFGWISENLEIGFV